MELKEPTEINTTELRLKTRDFLERVKFNGERFIVETFGRPMAVIISVDDYRNLILNSNKQEEKQVGSHVAKSSSKRRKTLQN